MPNAKYSVVQELDLLYKDKGFSKGVKGASKDVEQLHGHMGRLGRIFNEVGTHGIGRGFGDLKTSLRFFQSGNISAGVSSLGRSLDGMSKSAKGGALMWAGLAAAVTGAIAIGAKGIATYAALGSVISKIGFTTGIKGQQATDLWAQFKMTGVNAEQGMKSVAMFTKNLWLARKGTGNQALALKQLGINLKDSNGNWKSAAVLLPEVRKKLSETTDATLKAGAAQALFGRAWQGLSRWLSTDQASLDRVNKIMKDSGFTFDEKGYDDFIASQRRASLTWQLMWAQIGKAAAPVMEAVAKAMSTWGIKILGFFGKFYKAIGLVVGALVGMTVVVKLAGLWNAFSSTIGISTMQIGAAAAATDVETISLEANSVAVEANTVAWAENATARAAAAFEAGGATAVMGAGGVGRGALPLGEAAAPAAAAYGGGLGIGLAGGAIGALVGLKIAPPIENAISRAMSTPKSRQEIQDRFNAGAVMGGGGRAPTMIAPPTEKTTMSALMDKSAREKGIIGSISTAVSALQPSATNAGALGKYIDQLNHLAKTTRDPSVRDAAEKLAASLKDQSSAFNEAARNIAAYDQSLMDSMTGMDAFKTAVAAMTADQFVKAPLPAMAAAASMADQRTQLAATMANISSGKAGRVKGRLIIRPTSLNTVNNPDFRAGQVGVVHVHFHGTVVGGRQGMNELSNHVANTIMQGTRRHLAGQNA